MNDVEFTCYADDKTPYAIGTSIDKVIEALEDIFKELFQCFSINLMKTNPKKCHLICSTDKEVSVNAESQVIKSSKHR